MIEDNRGLFGVIGGDIQGLTLNSNKIYGIDKIRYFPF